MARADLPREVRNQPLAYEQLISALDLVEGECVIVRLTTRSDTPSMSGVASIVGEIHHERPGRYASDEFSIGTPYPDRNLEHPVGGVLFISEDDFMSAALTTTDGNDYFAFGIATRHIQMLIQDRDSTYP